MLSAESDGGGELHEFFWFASYTEDYVVVVRPQVQCGTYKILRLRNNCVRGPRLRNQSVKMCGADGPTHLFTLLLRNFGPQNPSGHNCRTIVDIDLSVYSFIGLPEGVDNYNHRGLGGALSGPQRVSPGA